MTPKAVLKRWHGLTPNLQGACWMLLSCLGFSAMVSFVKIAARELGPFETTFFRCFFGFLALFPLIAWHGIGALGKLSFSIRRVVDIAAWAQQGEVMAGLLCSDLQDRFKDRDPFRTVLSHLDVGRQLKGREAVNQSLYLWAKTLLPNYILSNLGDRMEMAHSIEGRLPFLDHHVVEEVAQIVGIPENTVKTRLFYARKKLAELLKAAGIERGWP